jgi:hypothetical protein
MAESPVKLFLQGQMPNKTMEPDLAVPGARHQAEWTGAAAAAATTITEANVYRALMPGVVKDILVVPGVAITRDDTNYSTLTFAKRTKAVPGTNVDFCVVSYKLTGGSFGANEVAFTEHSYSSLFDADITKRQFTTGDLITLKAVLTGGTGTSIPQGTRFVVIVEDQSS